MINPAARGPRYRLIADDFRAEILDGRRSPGSRFPSERDIAQIYGVNHHTAREAMRLLVREGLLIMRAGQPTRVRDREDRDVVDVRLVGLIGARPATEDEAAHWGVTEGSPILVELDEATRRELRAWPAERVILRSDDL